MGTILIANIVSKGLATAAPLGYASSECATAGDM